MSEGELLGAPAAPAPVREGEVLAFHLPACAGRPHALIMVVRPMLYGEAYISTYRPDFAPLIYQDTWKYRRLSGAAICARLWAAHPDKHYPLGAL